LALAREAGVLPPTYDELVWSNAALVSDEPPSYSEITKVCLATPYILNRSCEGRTKDKA